MFHMHSYHFELSRQYLENRMIVRVDFYERFPQLPRRWLVLGGLSTVDRPAAGLLYYGPLFKLSKHYVPDPSLVPTHGFWSSPVILPAFSVPASHDSDQSKFIFSNAHSGTRIVISFGSQVTVDCSKISSPVQVAWVVGGSVGASVVGAAVVGAGVVSKVN